MSKRRKPKISVDEYLKRYSATQASLSPKEKLSEEVLMILMQTAANEDIKAIWNNVSPEDREFYDEHKPD